MNHSFDPRDYLDSVPAERVAQIHIAGHSRYEKYILDTHDHPVIDPVWALYAAAIRRMRTDRDAAGVGRQDSVVRRSPRRGAEGEPLSCRSSQPCLGGRAGARSHRRRRWWRELAAGNPARVCPAHHAADDGARRHAHQHSRRRRKVPQAQRPADQLRAAGNLHQELLVSDH